MSPKKTIRQEVQKIVVFNILTNTIVMFSDRDRKVTPRYVPTVKLGDLQVGEEVKARWVGGDYKGDRYYDAVSTSIDTDEHTCALVFPNKMVPPPKLTSNWDTDTV
jgi:hypothetical protein